MKRDVMFLALFIATINNYYYNQRNNNPDKIGLIKDELRKNLNDHKGNIKYSKKMKLLPKEWNSIPSASNLDFSLETHNPIIFHTAGYIFKHKKELIEKFFINKDKIKFIN